MNLLTLHEEHRQLGARFIEVGGTEAVANYTNTTAEHGFLSSTAGLLDLSFRGRICLTGADRIRFLHGQVTNDIKRLAAGSGCYAVLVNAKGKMESDLNIYNLADELLLDFEPGFSERVTQRLEKFIVADDVQVVEVAPHYGLLSVQGPQAEAALRRVGRFAELPQHEFQFVQLKDATLGELYICNQPRLRSVGFDLFVPVESQEKAFEQLLAGVRDVGGGPCGWEALDLTRIEVSVPRFGADMSEANLPQECGIESRAVSYTKGCYIGQEVLNRIHTMGHVNRQLCGLRMADAATLPAHGDKLFHEDREVGYVTSTVKSPQLRANIALGFVRRESAQPGTSLVLRGQGGELQATVCELPFVPRPSAASRVQH